MKYKNILTPIVLVFFYLNAYASSDQQKGYKIEVNAPFKEGSVAYLANYWEGKTYTIDSTIVPKNGVFAFIDTEKNLDAGQYLLYIKPDLQVDFLLDSGQNNIKIKLNKDNFADSKIEGSKDSEIFWEYLGQLNILNADLEKDIALIKSTEANSEESKQAKERYKTKLKTIQNLFVKYADENRGTWVGAFIKATSPLNEPYPIPESKEQSLENARYVKEHYFDNIDLTDIRMWSTSFFTPQLKNYLREVISQHPDTIAKEASWVVSQTKTNDAAFEKMLTYLVNDATSSLNMGMENTWAKLGEDYIFEKKPDWIKDEQYLNLRAEYFQIEKNRIGMKGQNLKLMTIDGDSINTDEIDAELLLIYFYDPSCGHCRTEIPKLRNDIYTKYKDKGLKIVAINLDKDIDGWKAFIEQNNMGEWYNVFDPNMKSEYWLKYNTSGTPSLYLLDKNKTIMAKKLDSVNLDKYLEIILE